MSERSHTPPGNSAEAQSVGSPISAVPATEETGVAPARGWAQRLSSVLFIIFCFELGLFLLIYPWTDSWTQNYFSWLGAGRFHSTWHDFWDNTYFRGAVSGIGAVNVWIAMSEVFRMLTRRDHVK